MNVEQIGTRLTNYRKNNSMTIKEFSQISGVSTALLSQLERGMGNPSLSVLNAIAKTMNLSISTLFEDAVKLDNLVKRVADQPVLSDSTKDNLEFQLLTIKSSKVSDDLLRVIIKPHTETPYYPFGTNECEEIILVEKGALSVHSDSGDSVVLKKGDTMRLVPKLRYKIKNSSSHNAIILYIVSNAKNIL